MSFNRTAGGLKSLAAMYGVDIVLFCEGGSSGDNGSNPSTVRTLDEVFWSTFVHEFSIQKKIRVISRGSRSNVEDIFETVTTEKIETVGVCLDRDWTTQKPQKVFGVPRLTTLGYSWENDCVSISELAAACNNFVPTDTNTIETFDEYANEFTSELKVASQYLRFDRLLILDGKAGFFPRAKPLELMQNVGNKNISFDQDKMELKLIAMNPTFDRTLEPISSNDSRKNLFGHTLLSFALHKFGHYIHSQTGNKIPHNLLARMLIRTFFSNISKSSCEYNSHYHSCATVLS